MSGRPAVFLDRDGNLNREQSFITHPDQLVVLDGVPEALRRLDDAGYELVVVTNQSGIARGLYTETTLTRIHERMAAECDHRIRAFFHSPYHPDQSGPYGHASDCRKPGAGMIHRAAAMLDLSLEGSFVVGDSARDVLMTRDLPIHPILVRCGKPWVAELEKAQAGGVEPTVVDDMAAAAEWILSR